MLEVNPTIGKRLNYHKLNLESSLTSWAAQIPPKQTTNQQEVKRSQPQHKENTLPLAAN